MLEQLQRRSALEPDNQTLQLNVVAAMAREGRSSELVAPLMDRETWNKAGEYAQGLAAIEVGRRLGSDWELSVLRVWSCGVKLRDARLKPHPLTISHRLATYTHKPTGIEFNLLPGFDWVQWVGGSRRVVEGKIEPFLIARGPVTNDQAWHTHPRNGLGEDGMYDTDAAKGPLPAVGASFDEVKEYSEHNGFSLPSPAQWGYACKAGSETRFYFGDEFDPSPVWYAGNSGSRSLCFGTEQFNKCLENGDAGQWGCERHFESPTPHATAEHDKAGKWNAFGLVDMIGNVAEMTNKKSKQMGGSFANTQRQIEQMEYAIVTPMNQVGFRPIKTIDWSE